MPDAPLLTEAFDRSRITATRHAVASLAARCGLSGTRLEDFIFAVNEIVTNAVRHGGGRGELRLWLRRDRSTQLFCEIVDTGPGIPKEQLEAPPPPATSPTGRGIWLAQKMCDVMIDTSADGTVVRLTATI